MDELPSSVAKQIPSELLPDRVAIDPIENVSDKTEEKNCYLLSFYKYNNKVCGIDYLEKNGHKNALKTLVKIGQINCKDGELQKNNINKIRVENSHEYTKLFNKLHSDVELFEHKLHGKERMFYYIYENIMHIIAITSSHFETEHK
jgi:hypothetical protein